MRSRYRMMAFLACALTLVAGNAFAQKPAVTPTPVDVGTINELRIGTPLSTHTACTLGNPSPPGFILSYFLPPPDEYYTLLRADQCSACPGQGGVLLNVAHVVLSNPTLCGLRVTVSIVEADLTDPTCPVPDPAKPVCDPISYDLLPPGLGIWDYAMALPNGCCITSDSFLRITLDDFIGDCTIDVPELVVSAACNPCESWNFWGAGNEDEICSIGFLGNFVHYVEGDCCETTSSAKDSWGRVKSMYR